MKKRHSGEQIVAILRQADVALGKGQKVPEVCKQLGISEQTYYRWRTKYGGMDPQMARQLQERNVEHFLPTYEKVSQWRDRRVRHRRLRRTGRRGAHRARRPARNAPSQRRRSRHRVACRG